MAKRNGRGFVQRQANIKGKSLTSGAWVGNQVETVHCRYPGRPASSSKSCGSEAQLDWDLGIANGLPRPNILSQGRRRRSGEPRTGCDLTEHFV